ncbi:MAG: hypothetical protein HW421_1310 [Ignavibacteria bacterium]|nr:hypothetical protein [Ignavibacteria bacterium]
MRTIIIIFLIISSLSCLAGQEYKVEWVHNWQSEFELTVPRLCKDSSSNIYVIGDFRNTADFGNGNILKAKGTEDIFVIKFDTDGTLKWVKQLGGTQDDAGFSIVADKDGNIYISGYFFSTIYFDNQSITADGYDDMFIAKLDSSGKFIWMNHPRSATDGFEGATALAIKEHFLYAFVSFLRQVRFENLILNPINSVQDIAIVKLDTDGNPLWGKTYGGDGEDYSVNLSLDINDNIILSGAYCYGSFTEFQTTRLKNHGATNTIDGFHAKLNKNGDILWGYGIGSTSNDWATTCTYDNFDYSYFAGMYQIQSDFGNGQILKATNNSAHGYLIKYNTNGSCQWAKTINSTESMMYINSDHLNNIYATGYTIGPSDFGNSNSTTNIGRNVFMAIYDLQGVCQEYYSSNSLSNGKAEGSSICNGNDGSIYITGSFSGTVDFGNGNIITAKSNNDIFVLKLTSTGSCTDDNFEYPNFSSIDNLKFVSNARQAGKAIRLTEATPMTQSAIWYGDLVNAGKGFETVFSFRMSQGFNATDDGSSPGAEGIAFVIQNSSLSALGFPAGNIGFAGIPNSVAIEFDTYNNKTDMYDPDGNHVAVFSNGIKGNYAFHNPQFCLGTSSNIPQLRADNTLYYAKIDYNMEPGKLRVWLDNTDKFDGNPALTIDKFELAKAINLDNGRAYIGFTSATGDSYQIHEIQSWKYCSNAFLITGVPENKELQSGQPQLMLNPNPVDNIAYLSFYIPTGGDAEISIFDILGNTLYTSHESNLNVGQNSKAVDCRSIPVGIYYGSVKTMNDIKVAPFVIQR